MKEDYLWDKTGSDAEIEQFEKALSVFRYQETEPPALPAKIIPFERKQPKNFFRLAFAFSAAAAVVAICFGVWLQVSSNKLEVAVNPIEKSAPPILEKNINQDAIQKPINSPIVEAKISQPIVEPKIIKVRKAIRPIERQDKAIARTKRIKKPDVQLTQDEKYAYDQLMLALSITSSKFKLVKDKVENIEEKNAVRQNAR